MGKQSYLTGLLELFQGAGAMSICLLEFLTHEDGVDSLCRNLGAVLPLIAA